MNQPRTKQGLLWTLAVMNVVLVAGLAMRLSTETANAQAGRSVGEYLLIPGEATGANVGIVYVLDEVNGTLGAIAPDNSDKLNAMEPVNLQRIFDAAAQGGGNNRRK
jgi:hypothetical protein